MLSGNLKQFFFPDFTCTHGRMCEYGYCTTSILIKNKKKKENRKKVNAALTVVV